GCFQGNANQVSDDILIYKQVLEDTTQKLKLISMSETARYKELLEVLANLYVKGCEIDWKALHINEPKQHVSLPTYPFLKERYWVPTGEDKHAIRSMSDLH